MTSTDTKTTSTAWQEYDRALAVLDQAWTRVRTCAAADLAEALIALDAAQKDAWKGARDLHPDYGDRLAPSVGYTCNDPEDWISSLVRHQEKTLAAHLAARSDADADYFSGKAMLELVEALRGELDEVRGDHAAAVMLAEERRGDYELAVKQWQSADALLAEARAQLDADDRHADCAWVPDLESAKASITTTATERDRARKDAKNLRLQRNTLIAAAFVIIVVLTLVSIPTWG